MTRPLWAAVGFVVVALIAVPLVARAPLFSYAVHTVFPQKSTVRIVFGGDMMFDRSIRIAAENQGGDFLFACLDPVFVSADMVVTNLEGPITDNPSVSRDSKPGDSNNFTFTFPPSTATLLYSHNVRMVNLGNNHIMNFSRDGVRQTKRYLDAAGVDYFGDPELSDMERTVRKDIHGVRFSFVNWSDWTSDNTDTTAAAIRAEAQQGRVVVVYTHWGEEYVPATERMKRLARAFVDEGATIVIGSHPHVVQEHEVYKGKHIYYSLGNLIFDQYWNDEVSHGLLLEAVFDESGVHDVREIRVQLGRNRQTCPIE